MYSKCKALRKFRSSFAGSEIFSVFLCVCAGFFFRGGGVFERVCVSLCREWRGGGSLLSVMQRDHHVSYNADGGGGFNI